MMLHTQVLVPLSLAACCVWLLCVVAPSLLQFSMYWLQL